MVVFPQGQRGVLLVLYEGPTGMTMMNSLSKIHVWWPNIEKDFEALVRDCAPCLEQQLAPTVAPLLPWKWPSRPCDRVHMDFACPSQGRMILVLIDTHS